MGRDSCEGFTCGRDGRESKDVDEVPVELSHDCFGMEGCFTGPGSLDFLAAGLSPAGLGCFDGFTLESPAGLGRFSGFFVEFPSGFFVVHKGRLANVALDEPATVDGSVTVGDDIYASNKKTCQ